MNQYTIYCTPEQTKKALELGAPIETCDWRITDTNRYIELDNEKGWHIQIPTAEQMIGWLEEQGLWIHFCKPNQRPELLSFSVSKIKEPFKSVFIGREYNSRKEATIAAIDAALEYLRKNINK